MAFIKDLAFFIGQSKVVDTMPILGIDGSRALRKEKTGVEWYSYFLLRAMQRCTPKGWKVRCYVPGGVKSEELRIKNDNWHWKELRWPGRGWTQGRLSLEMLKSPPDVLFVPSHVIPLVHPEQTVTTVHDVVFVRQPELYDPADLEAQKRGLDFALNFARKIIVPSRAVREGVVAAGGKPEQIVVIQHGVEVEIPNYKFQMINKFQIPNSKFILFVGRLERKKNVLGFINAFRRLQSEAGLVLAGQLGFGGQDVLQAIKTFKLEKRVVHLGYVERAQYLDLLKHAALLVLPSFGEGFGLPVLEAMVAGVPVVCSDIPVLREVGGNAPQYVNPRDPEDIAHGMESVLKNEMLASEMARRGKEIAARYTWDKAARSAWDVICSTIGP